MVLITANIEHTLIPVLAQCEEEETLNNMSLRLYDYVLCSHLHNRLDKASMSA